LIDRWLFDTGPVSAWDHLLSPAPERVWEPVRPWVLAQDRLVVGTLRRTPIRSQRAAYAGGGW